jgi:hypothetical protein
MTALWSTQLLSGAKSFRAQAAHRHRLRNRRGLHAPASPTAIASAEAAARRLGRLITAAGRTAADSPGACSGEL